MKTKSKLISLLMTLIIALSIYSDNASGSIQVIIKFPKNMKNSTASIYSSYPSSITPSSLSHKSPDIEVVDFLIDSNICMRIKNNSQSDRCISLKVTLIGQESKDDFQHLEYNSIKMNPDKKIKILLKDKKIKDMKNGMIIVEVLEDNVSILSVGGNKNSGIVSGNLASI